jgi:hypothetical protein
MSIFSIALFLHIVGALGVSMALGLEWIGLSHVRRATVLEEIRTILMVVKGTTRFGFVSMLATAITGFYMVLNGVGWVPWILVVLGALLLVIGLTRVLTAPRMAAISRALAMEKGLVSPALHNLLNDRMLWISIQTRMAVVLGIIFLKIATPGLSGALLTISAAIALALASSLPMPRRVRAQKTTTDVIN